MRLTLLGSGSSGNVALVEAGPTRLLIDAGLPKEELLTRLARVPSAGGALTIDRIDAVLVTHDHNDHAGCAVALGRPIWATEGTRQACAWNGTHRVLAGRRFTIGEIDVLPVLLPHDAVETVGYVLESGGARVGILTDCGHDAADVAAAYAGCHALVLETNHDATLLKHGPYPPSLKRRVGGRLGHLSNDQSAALLRAICLADRPPSLVIAAHLSLANNRPRLAKSALDRVLGRGGQVIIATQAHGAPPVAVDGSGRVTVEPALHAQLTFVFPNARGGEELLGSPRHAQGGGLPGPRLHTESGLP